MYAADVVHIQVQDMSMTSILHHALEQILPEEMCDW